MWAEYDRPFIIGDTGGRLFPSINGHLLEVSFPALQWTRELPVLSMRTHAGTDILWKLPRGLKAPVGYGRKEVTLSRVDVAESDWGKLEEVIALAMPVWFGDGVPVTDIFQATAGSSYTLMRPLASGIVPGVSEVTHPTRVFLDGVLTPAAATVAGQTVDALSTGEIRVEYVPALRVYPSGGDGAIPGYSELDLTIRLVEIVQGDFG